LAVEVVFVGEAFLAAAAAMAEVESAMEEFGV
jgi:hypothetical protein